MSAGELESKPLEEVATLQCKFGVGCAQLVPKDKNRSFKNFDDYVKELERSLNRIAAIRDITIESMNAFNNFESGLPCPFPSLNEGEDPIITGGAGIELRVSMHLYIPTRTQKLLLRIDDEIEWEAFSDIFVTISSGFECPVMIVQVEVKSAYDPSDAVVITRKFLEAELKNNTNCEFLFDTIGPSPFHADFYIYNVTDTTDKYSFKTLTGCGYDEIKFFSNKTISARYDINNVLFSDLMAQFDLFYSIQLGRVKVMDEWSRLIDEVRQIEYNRKQMGKFRRVVDFFFPTSKVYDAVSEIVDFRLLVVGTTSIIKDRVSDLNSLGEKVQYGRI